MRVGGVVLCGGRSSRMGRPKAWLPFHGELMLPRVVRLLSEVVDPIVVAAAGQELPLLPQGVAVVRDEVEGRGPLQGLAAGLKAMSDRAEAAYLSSCDAPLLRSAFVRRLAELIGDALVCVPFIGEYCHPLSALYRVEISEVVDRQLAANRLSLLSLFAAVPTRVVQAAELADVDPLLQTLRNVNTPEEYEAALHAASAETGT